VIVRVGRRAEHDSLARVGRVATSDRVLVRRASLRDIEDLVELRLENGRVHAALDPVAHRVPDADAVRVMFTDRLTIERADPEVVLVAERSDQVVGMVEVLVRPLAPEGDILMPRRSAYIHTVVRSQARGTGAGRALVASAEAWSREQDVEVMVAVIQRDNEPATTFYGDAGYRAEGMITMKTIATTTGS
jgi:GNAT superfamily N-acetyltransferase